MIKFPQHILFFVLFLQVCSSCNSNRSNTLVKQNEVASSIKIFGLYSYFVTGYNAGCESVKHSLRLNADSTFIFKIYCYADSSSLFPVTLKTGKFIQLNDSIFNFVYPDNTSFKAAFLNDSTIQIIPDKKDEKFNYPFFRDTTTDEKFWQPHKR